MNLNLRFTKKFAGILWSYLRCKFKCSNAPTHITYQEPRRALFAMAEKVEKGEKGDQAKANSVQEFSTDLLKVYYGKFYCCFLCS